MVSNPSTGACATDIARITDSLLIKAIRRQSSITGRSETVQRYQNPLQPTFNAPGDNRDLAVQIGTLPAALDALVASPETSAAALPGPSAIEEVSRAIGGLADQGQPPRGDADQEIGRTVDAINGDIQAIHELNAEIKRLALLGDVSPELLERRHASIQSLAKKIDVRT